MFAPLTSALDTSWDRSRVERSSDTYVKTLSSDGGDGIRVTYVVRKRTCEIGNNIEPWNARPGNSGKRLCNRCTKRATAASFLMVRSRL